MMNTDSYYQPEDDRAWEAFVKHCELLDLDPDEEDFDEWMDAEEDRAMDAAIERAEAAREDYWDE
jgi:hypothetical protein